MGLKQYEGQQTENPSLDIFGYPVTLPPQSTPLLLTLIFITNLVLILKSKPVGFAIDLLRGADLQLLENLDDIAVELRELTQADRVLITGFHNGKQNILYHWRRISTLAEATRFGVESVLHKTKDLDTISVFSSNDYEFLKTLGAHKTFIHINRDLSTISIQQRRFLINCYMFGQYVMLLQDDVLTDPYGAIFIQYDSPEKCEVSRGGEVGWSSSVTNSAYQKVMRVNSLIYDRGTSRATKVVHWIKKKLGL
jgi:hypothetical protein